jgi:hypothetical protein
MTNTISNTEDIIDSRAVIARIEELETEREALTDAFTEAEDALVLAVQAGEGVQSANRVADETARALAEWDGSEDGDELAALRKLAEEAEGYAADWPYGEALIRDSYFVEYAQQLADDLGAVNSEASWPNNCIDWDRAASELQQDYTAVDFAGVTYWIR